MQSSIMDSESDVESVKSMPSSKDEWPAALTTCCCRVKCKGGCWAAFRRHRRIIAFVTLAIGLSATLLGIFIAQRSYILGLLITIQHANPVLCVGVFLGLYTLVSWPFAYGYSIVNIAGGYLFGLMQGVALSSAGSCIGVFTAHMMIRKLLFSSFEPYVNKNPYLRSIAKLLSSKEHGYKMVLLSRMTLIPFGLQNVVFAVSAIETRLYMAVSVVGLIPIQCAYAYLGSTLRSVEEILSSEGSNSTRLIFCGEMLLGLFFMYWVFRKARAEINRTISLSAQKKEEGDPSVHVV